MVIRVTTVRCIRAHVPGGNIFRRNRVCPGRDHCHFRFDDSFNSLGRVHRASAFWRLGKKAIAIKKRHSGEILWKRLEGDVFCGFRFPENFFTPLT